MNSLNPHDSDTLALSVSQASLDKTFEQYPHDVTIAFQTAAKLRATSQLSCDPLTEFWPPMKVKS